MGESEKSESDKYESDKSEGESDSSSSESDSSSSESEVATPSFCGICPECTFKTPEPCKPCKFGSNCTRVKCCYAHAR